MAILDTVKKIGLRVKTATGYITYKLGSEFVQMDNGKDLQTAFDDLNGELTELNSNLPFGGQIMVENTTSAADVVHGYVTFDYPMPNTNYRAIAILVTANEISGFDENYDVNVSISAKKKSGFTIDIHRGGQGFLAVGGQWILDYIVLP